MLEKVASMILICDVENELIMSGDDEDNIIELQFESLPFAFDEEGNIRCLKCHNAGWRINGELQSGISWDKKQGMESIKDGDRYNLPDGWSREGEYDRDNLDVDSWKHMVNESWRQVRHLGKQRSSYVRTFGGVSVLGLLFTIVGSDIGDLVKAGIFFILTAYTAFHTIMSLKMGRAYSHNIDHIDLLSAIRPEKADAGSFAMLRSMKGMDYRNQWRDVQLSSIVPKLYFILIFVWFAVFVYYLGQYSNIISA